MGTGSTRSFTALLACQPSILPVIHALFCRFIGHCGDEDREFLMQGGVFDDDQIDAYIDLKFQEIYKFEHTPHPIEFEMYYSQ